MPAVTPQAAQAYYNTLTPDQKAQVDATGGPSVQWLQNAINAGVPKAMQAAGYSSASGERGGGVTGGGAPSTDWLGKRKPTPAELKAHAQQSGWSEDFARFEDRQIAKWIQDNWDVQRGVFLNDFGDAVEKPTESGPQSRAAGFPTGEGPAHGGVKGFGGGGGGGRAAPTPQAGAQAAPSAYAALDDPLQARLFDLFQNRGGFAGEIGPTNAQSLAGGGVWSWNANQPPPQPAIPTPLSQTGGGGQPKQPQQQAWSPQNVASAVQNVTAPPAAPAVPTTPTPGVTSGLANFKPGVLEDSLTKRFPNQKAAWWM